MNVLALALTGVVVYLFGWRRRAFEGSDRKQVGVVGNTCQGLDFHTPLVFLKPVEDAVHLKEEEMLSEVLFVISNVKTSGTSTPELCACELFCACYNLNNILV